MIFRRRFLAIKKLDDSDELDSLKKYPRQSKYEVGSAEWNPTISNYHFCAISVSYCLKLNRSIRRSGMFLDLNKLYFNRVTQELKF